MIYFYRIRKVVTILKYILECKRIFLQVNNPMECFLILFKYSFPQ